MVFFFSTKAVLGTHQFLRIEKQMYSAQRDGSCCSVGGGDSWGPACVRSRCQLQLWQTVHAVARPRENPWPKRESEGVNPAPKGFKISVN